MSRIAARVGVVKMVLLALAAMARADDILVDASGSGQFKSIQAAVDSVPANNSSRVRIVIKPGKYEELINIPADKPFISFIGEGKAEDILLTYHLKSSDPRPDGRGNVGTTGSASTTISGNDFLARNITFANSAGDNVGQAVAIKPQADRMAFFDCRFLGFQDTLYPSGGGRQYYKDCYITGDTDFIFGNATVVFDHCTINSSDSSYITAANTTPRQAFGFVFLDCTLTAGPSVRPDSVYLGRPWQWDRGSSAAVTFIRTKMGPHIRPEGWHPWDAQNNTHPEQNTRYAEFGSTDLAGKPLDLSKRVAWSKQITAQQAEELTVPKILAGNDRWDPTPSP